MRFLLLSLSLFIIRLGGFAQNIELRSLTTYAPDMSDIWGYSDGEHEYALASTSKYFTIVDVTDPENPVKLHQVDGPNSYWRDIKTWGNYAYGVQDIPNNPNQGVGITIMNLSDLQNEMPVSFWKNDGSLSSDLKIAHNIFIDEFGYAYICGHNFGSGGVLILDLTQDPENPTVVGEFTNNYVHDCYVRDNILYTSDENSNGGTFTIVDVSDKSNLTILATENTPGNTSHNNWLSDDGQTIFTTDENSGAYLAAYDISDFNDIEELDRYRSSPGMSVIPHNVFIKDDFAIISYYRDGVKILDVSQPDNMVEVGGYDTSPNFSGNGFNGAWGVYPYLPSGNILVTDIEEGLYVLTPTYKRATQIKGIVTDLNSGNPIFDATVEIKHNSDTELSSSNLSGQFGGGFTSDGAFTLTVSKNGYSSYSETFNLNLGDVKEVQVELEKTTAVNNALTDKITLVQNPVKQLIRLRNEIEVRAPMQINLYDLSGQLVTSMENDGDANISIPVDYLNNGVYILEIMTDDSLIGWAKVLKN